MAILDDLQALYDNGWDASFVYKGQNCAILPNSVHDIVVVIGDNTLINIMDGIEVQYY